MPSMSPSSVCAPCAQARQIPARPLSCRLPFLCSVGKGRQIAALIKQHWADGGRRALWVSVSAGAPVLGAINCCCEIARGAAGGLFLRSGPSQLLAQAPLITLPHEAWPKLSLPTDLRHDAARDLKDVLASHIPVCPRVRACHSSF